MTGVIATIPRYQFLSPLGVPLVGGKLYTYLAGTTTPTDTFLDQDLSAKNENPIKLDATGSATIWLDPAKQYKFVLKNALGITQPGWPIDNISGAATPVSLGPVLSAYAKLSALASAAGAGLVGFLQAGAGAILRTILDKLRESVSVADFGDVDDGVADAAPAAQKALNTGKNVRFTAPGTYLINSSLQALGNQTIIVEDGATIKVGAAMRAAIQFVDRSNVSVRGRGVIDCNSLATSGVLFQTSALSASDFVARDVTIKNTKSDPTLQFGGVEVSSAGGAGGPRAKRITMKGLNLLNTGTHGAIVAYADGVKFSGNFVDTTQNHGFEAVDCTNVVQTWNTLRNTTLSALGVGTHTQNWVIAHNTIDSAGGDGAITCEHNSPNGAISNNLILNANGSSGINISFGTPAAAPLNCVQNVKVTGNIISCKAGLLNRYGINFYSSTGTGLGKGVSIEGNTIDGFNVGVAYQYGDSGSVKNNIIRNLVGANSVMVLAQLVTRTQITGNTCDTDTGDHAIKLLSYAGQDCDKCTVSGNTMLATNPASKSMVYIEGAGAHTVSNNYTGGSMHYVECPGTASVLMSGNNGNLTSTPYSGANVTATGNGNSTQDVALVAGRRITMGPTAPTSGIWSRGDVCFNIDAAVGSPQGWRCTVAGSPGTWPPMSNL